jgi:hypothetical protein
VTGRRVRRRFALADDGIIDLIAVEITARGTRPVALTTRAALRAAGVPPHIPATLRSRLRLIPEPESTP